MLDKSLPYRNIVMRIPGEAVPLIRYSLRFFQEGDETAWAAVETSVGEFETEAEALDYFRQDSLPYLEALKRRRVFVCAPCGRAMGTATAWFAGK